MQTQIPQFVMKHFIITKYIVVFGEGIDDIMAKIY